MGFHYNAAGLTTLRSSIVSIKNACTSALSETQAAIKNISSTNSMQGTGADEIKAYLSTVHSASICNGFLEVIELINQAFRAYETKYCDLDGGSEVDAVIDTDELEAIKSSIQKYKLAFESAAHSFINLSNSVSDISSYSYNGDQSGLSDGLDDCTKDIDKIVNGINAIESSASDAGIDSARTALQGILQLIWKGSELSPSKFSAKEFLASKEFSIFYQAMVTADTTLQHYNADKAHCDDVLGKIDAEWKRRAKVAKYAKIGMAIFAGVGIAVFAPLGIAGAALIGGFIGIGSGALGEKLDQWSNGSAALNEGYDWGRIVKSGGIGGLKGMAGGAVGGSFAVLGGPGTSLLGKIGLGFSEEFSSNMLGTGIDLVDAVADGNFIEEWNRVNSDEYRLELVGKSAATGTTGTVLKEGIDWLGEGFKGLPAVKNGSLGKTTVGKIGTEATFGATKKVASKSLEDITNTFIETGISSDDQGNVQFGASAEEWKGNWQSTWENMRDKAVQRAITGGIEKGTPLVVEQIPGVTSFENESQTTLYHRNAEGRITTSEGRIVDGRTKEGLDYKYHEQQKKGAFVSTAKSASKFVSWDSDSFGANLSKEQQSVDYFSKIPQPVKK